MRKEQTLVHTTTPRQDYSFSRGARTAWRGVVNLAKKKPLIFIWVNFFGTWFVMGGAVMLARGSTSILPVACLLTPIVVFPWLMLVASKYGFSRLLGLPRAVPWLVAMAIAVGELATGGYVDQPGGYYVWLVGFVVINGIATLLDGFDIFRWLRGDRQEHPDTGFFSAR